MSDQASQDADGSPLAGLPCSYFLVRCGESLAGQNEEGCGSLLPESRWIKRDSQPAQRGVAHLCDNCKNEEYE